MKLKVYTVDVQLPRWSKRLLLFTALSAAMAISVVAVVRAATSSVPNTFADGDMLSASKMNANFSSLQTQLDSTNGALTTVQQTMLAPDANGNVGIGTKSPTARLHVASTSNLDGIRLSQTGNGLADFKIGLTNNDDGLSRGVVKFQSSIDSGTLTDRMVISASGNVGIGTATPQSRLDVNGSIQISSASIPMGLMSEGAGTAPLLNVSVNFREPNVNTTYRGAGFRIDTRTDQPLFGWFARPAGAVGDGLIMALTEAGNLGIQTAGPQYALDVSGIIRGVNVSPSDRTLKKNIAPLPPDTSTRVQKLDGVAFEWDQQKTSGLSTKPQIGLIAQEVEKVFPSLVETDGKGIKSVHYMGVTAVLLEAVKAQQKQIEELKNHVRVLENRLSPTASAATKPVAGRRLARRDVL